MGIYTRNESPLTHINGRAIGHVMHALMRNRSYVKINNLPEGLITRIDDLWSKDKTDGRMWIFTKGELKFIPYKKIETITFDDVLIKSLKDLCLDIIFKNDIDIDSLRSLTIQSSIDAHHTRKLQTELCFALNSPRELSKLVRKGLPLEQVPLDLQVTVVLCVVEFFINQEDRENARAYFKKIKSSFVHSVYETFFLAEITLLLYLKGYKKVSSKTIKELIRKNDDSNLEWLSGLSCHSNKKHYDKFKETRNLASEKLKAK